MEWIAQGIFEVNGKYHFETVRKQFSESDKSVNVEIQKWKENISQYLVVPVKKKVHLLDGMLLFNFMNLVNVYMYVNNVPVYQRNLEGNVTRHFSPEEACYKLNKYCANGFSYEKVIATNQRYFQNEILKVEAEIKVVKQFITAVKDVVDSSGVQSLNNRYCELLKHEDDLKEWKIKRDKHEYIVAQNELVNEDEKRGVINLLNNL